MNLSEVGRGHSARVITFPEPSQAGVPKGANAHGACYRAGALRGVPGTRALGRQPTQRVSWDFRLHRHRSLGEGKSVRELLPLLVGMASGAGHLLISVATQPDATLDPGRLSHLLEVGRGSSVSVILSTELEAGFERPVPGTRSNMSLGKSRNVTLGPASWADTSTARANSPVERLGPASQRKRGRRLSVRSADSRGSVVRLLIFAAGLGSGAAILAQDTAAPRNTDPDVAYMGSKVCAGCHREIYDSYVASAMGRSMMPVDAAAEPFPADAAPVVSERLNRRFFNERRPDGIYQRETEAKASGKPPFDNAHRLAYVIGSGVNGFSYLVRRGNFLVQAPLSYYRRTATWGLSPGYEFATPGEDYGFNRTIHAACLQCHAGRPRPQADQAGLYEDPPFAELAIGCENCHGAGSCTSTRD